MDNDVILLVMDLREKVDRQAEEIADLRARVAEYDQACARSAMAFGHLAEALADATLPSDRLTR